MTNGDPRAKFKFVPSPHLPIIAANKDLTFKGASALPRFGHGAFLECLESLYIVISISFLSDLQLCLIKIVCVENNQKRIGI
jgi:ribonucleotide monophosphatase NagD (HAD superfamily)